MLASAKCIERFVKRIVYVYIYTYSVSRGECAKIRENVPCVKLHRSNPKHLYPKLNGYGDNGVRNVWSSCGSKCCTCLACTLPKSVLQSHSRGKHIPTSLSTDVTVTVNCNSVLLDLNAMRFVSFSSASVIYFRTCSVRPPYI
jgi:hypothetical protein